MILGLFTDKDWLNKAIETVRKNEPECILYYKEVEVNSFNTVLPNFWTIHPERLIQIDRKKDYV